MQPKILNHISVKNDHEIFGILRSAGTTIYNEDDSKTYLLLRKVFAWECLAVVDEKKELVKSTSALLVLNVANFFDALWGYDFAFGGGFGTLTPDIVDGEQVENLRADISDFHFGLVSGTKLNGLNNVNINIEGFGDIVVPWSVSFNRYIIIDNTIKTYLETQEGNNLNITVQY